jgi:hypothetical protein
MTKSVLVVAALVLIGAVGLSKWRGDVHAQAQSTNAAVIFECNFPSGTNWVVILESSSPNAPAIALGTDCAAALQTLFQADFAISSTVNDNGLPRYTLVRPKSLARD